MKRWLFSAVCVFLLAGLPALAQNITSTAGDKDAELAFVVYFSRHGVRAPTGEAAQYNPYSISPWPAWEVPPAYLTEHGYQLIRKLGAYERMQLTKQGLFTTGGCTDISKVTFYADSDQRTQMSGKALAEGIFPGCKVAVGYLPEGTQDPLFHSLQAGIGTSAATAALLGRVGGSARNLTEAYRPGLEQLDKIMASCGTPTAREKKRTSLFDIPINMSTGKDGKFAEPRGPLNTASTLTENLLLEYTQGMDAANVGWGCVNATNLRSLMDLHTAAADFTQRTPAIAKMLASNLLDHIRRALEQAATHRAVSGSPSKPADRALFLIGHDTNIASMSGLLDLTWIEDGRRDDTPPGGTLVFELWKKRGTGSLSVRMYYTAQTLEQMRNSADLSLSNPPERVPLFVPGCSTADFSCPWPAFSRTVQQAIDAHYVNTN